MNHDDSSQWAIIMHDDDSSWWTVMTHHDDTSWWIVMIHHVIDASWWFIKDSTCMGAAPHDYLTNLHITPLSHITKLRGWIFESVEIKTDSLHNGQIINKTPAQLSPPEAAINPPIQTVKLRPGTGLQSCDLQVIWIDICVALVLMCVVCALIFTMCVLLCLRPLTGVTKLKNIQGDAPIVFFIVIFCYSISPWLLINVIFC